MPTISKGTWGQGILNPGLTHIWSAEITAGRVWTFWCDATAFDFNPRYVTVERAETVREGNTLRVRVWVHCPHYSPYPAGYILRWSAVN